MVLAREIELGAVAGGEDDRFALAAAPQAPGSARGRARPAHAARSAPCGATRRECRASCGEVGQGKDDRDEREAGEVQERRAAAPPALVPEHEQPRVRGQDQRASRPLAHRVAALEAGRTDPDSDRQHDERAEHRARGEPVERVQRRHPQRRTLRSCRFRRRSCQRYSDAIAAASVNPAKAASIKTTCIARTTPERSPWSNAGPAAGPGEREQRRRDRHHRQPEQPVAGRQPQIR